MANSNQTTTDEYIVNPQSGGGGEHPVGIYLPNSNSKQVICEAYVDNFDANKSTWGYGISPLRYTAFNSNTGHTLATVDDPSSPISRYRRYDENEDAIWLGSSTAGGTYNFLTTCYVGCISNPFTIYLVVKLDSSISNSLPTIVSCGYPGTLHIRQENATTLTMCAWNGISANNITGFSKDEWIVLAWRNHGLRQIGSNTFTYGVISKNTPTISSANWKQDSTNFRGYETGDKIILGFYYPTFSIATNLDQRFWANLYVKYFGCLPVAESDQSIKDNMTYLLNTFL